MRIKGTMQVSLWEDGERVVKRFLDGPRAEPTILRGEEAERHLAKQDRNIGILQVLFLPASAVFYLLVGIHNGIEWLFAKIAGER